jgi:hypothetical protein
MCTPVTSGLLKSYMSSRPWSNKAWASGELVWILRSIEAHAVHGEAFWRQACGSTTQTAACTTGLADGMFAAPGNGECCMQPVLWYRSGCAEHGPATCSESGMPQSCIGTFEAAGFSVYGSMIHLLVKPPRSRKDARSFGLRGVQENLQDRIPHSCRHHWPGKCLYSAHVPLSIEHYAAACNLQQKQAKTMTLTLWAHPWHLLSCCSSLRCPHLHHVALHASGRSSRRHHDW